MRELRLSGGDRRGPLRDLRYAAGRFRVINFICSPVARRGASLLRLSSSLSAGPNSAAHGPWPARLHRT
jgi:hypothetical protein